MKQYTTPEQTTKLIELGFEKPRLLYFGNSTIGNYAYTIGELIEMLLRKIRNYYDLSILSTSQYWRVLYGMIGDGDMWSVEYEIYRVELIDTLYDMVVKLKEKGVI